VPEVVDDRILSGEQIGALLFAIDEAQRNEEAEPTAALAFALADFGFGAGVEVHRHIVAHLVVLQLLLDRTLARARAADATEEKESPGPQPDVGLLDTPEALLAALSARVTRLVYGRRFLLPDDETSPKGQDPAN
jgi:hypothetical protein